jgi:hypothetical protein
MDLTSANDSAKRKRAKVVVKAPAIGKPSRKTLAIRQKTAGHPIIIESSIESSLQAAVDVQGEIAKTAFYLAAERNFAPGHELDDWLEAERRIKSLHPA